MIPQYARQVTGLHAQSPVYTITYFLLKEPDLDDVDGDVDFEGELLLEDLLFLTEPSDFLVDELLGDGVSPFLVKEPLLLDVEGGVPATDPESGELDFLSVPEELVEELLGVSPFFVKEPLPLEVDGVSPLEELGLVVDFGLEELLGVSPFLVNEPVPLEVLGFFVSWYVGL
jgi:hypothetical protein